MQYLNGKAGLINAPRHVKSGPMRILKTVACALLVCSTSALADGPTIEIAPPGSVAVNPNKVTLIVGPEALSRAMVSGVAGGENWVTLDLDVGLFTGIRAAILPYQDEHLIVAVEGFIGAALLSPAYGGGVRVQFRVAQSAKNALLVSPGLDVLVSPTDPSYFGHSGTQVFALANADVSWLHEFAAHFAYELGLRAGGGFWVNATEPGVHPVPEIELFTGFRF